MAQIEAADGVKIKLKTGKHYRLIKALIEKFIPYFVPGSKVLYVSGIAEKWGYFDEAGLAAHNVKLDMNGKMPDVIIHYPAKNWVLLVEAGTSHGTVNAKRRDELAKLFASCSAGVVYMTIFPTRADMTPYVGDISWKTDVWFADAPTHMLHYNGDRYRGPYGKASGTF